MIPGPYWALLVVYLVWGTTLGFIAIGVHQQEPALFAVSRFLLAGVLMVGFCRWRGEAWPTRAEWLRHSLVALLLLVCGHAAVYWTLRHIPVGVGGLLGATNPFWMLWLSSLIPPKEPVPTPAYLGVAVGFLGMLTLVWPQLSQPHAIDGVVGMSMGGALISTLFWCVGSIVARRVALPQSVPMSVGLQNLLAAVMLLPICLLTVQRWTWTQESATALFYLVGMGTILATSCYWWVLRTLPVTAVSSVAYVTPVITLCFGHFILGEPWTLNTALGGLILLVGVILVQVLSRRGQPAVAEAEPDPPVLTLALRPTAGVASTHRNP